MEKALKYGLMDDRPIPENGDRGPVGTLKREVFELSLADDG